MLEDEITWLDNFEPNRTAECETSEADNILLAGHLRLIKTLLSLCGAEKEIMVFTLVIYGCESWTIKKAECWRTDAFELWY